MFFLFAIYLVNGNNVTLKGRRLAWHKFSCHMGNTKDFKLGFAVDAGFLKKYSSEAECEKKLRQVAKEASEVYKQNFGFGLNVVTVIFPTDMPSCTGDQIGAVDRYRASKLADKAPHWVFWTGCQLRAPGIAYLNAACSAVYNKPTCILSRESMPIFVHELGHNFGAQHGTGSNSIMQAGPKNHNYKGEHGQFHEDHDREVCNIVNKIKSKSQCWTPAGQTPPSTPPSTPPGTPPTPPPSTPPTPPTPPPSTPPISPPGTPPTPPPNPPPSTTPNSTKSWIVKNQVVLISIVLLVILLVACFFMRSKGIKPPATGGENYFAEPRMKVRTRPKKQRRPITRR